MLFRSHSSHLTRVFLPDLGPWVTCSLAPVELWRNLKTALSKLNPTKAEVQKNGDPHPSSSLKTNNLEPKSCFVIFVLRRIDE